MARLNLWEWECPCYQLASSVEFHRSSIQQCRSDVGGLHCQVTCVAWGGCEKDLKRRATDRYQFATAGVGVVRLWSLDPRSGTLATDKCQTGAHLREHTCLVFSSDGEYLYAPKPLRFLEAINAHCCCRVPFYTLWNTRGTVARR